MVSESWRDLRPRTAVSGETDGTTGYIEYFQVERLHTLQRPVTETAYEMAFLVSSQVMELYFGLLCHELGRAGREVRGDDARAASATLRRSVGHLRALEATWESYADMTPADWNPIKARLGKGESSSVHSYMYRHLAFLLGLKSAEMLEPHRSTRTSTRGCGRRSTRPASTTRCWRCCGGAGCRCRTPPSTATSPSRTSRAPRPRRPGRGSTGRSPSPNCGSWASRWSRSPTTSPGGCAAISR
ncbi:tryptophan 2,3-dioxygenase family protein [Streptomyces sp. M19]